MDSFLKLAGAAVTGGEAKTLVLGGRVAVNGEVCAMRGKKLYDGDTVSSGGREYAVSRKNED